MPKTETGKPEVRLQPVPAFHSWRSDSGRGESHLLLKSQSNSPRNERTFHNQTPARTECRALPFLESVQEVAAKLKEPETKERKFEDMVKSAEQAAVDLVVCRAFTQP